MKRHVRTLAAAAALALGASAAPTFVAQAATTSPEPRSSCFASNQWQGWSAPAAGHGDLLLLRVGLHDIYRVDLTPGSHAYKYGGSFLINKMRGSNWICSHLDLDLAISETGGGYYRQPLIATSLRKLTPTEIAAIPKKDLP